MNEEKDYMKRMTDALRSGAKMLSEHCPVCGSPIFEIKGELWCLKCNKRVIKIKSEEEIGMAVSTYSLMNTISVLSTKVEELTVILARTVDLEEIRRISETLNIVLGTIEQTIKLLKIMKEEQSK
ncbi:MAG: Sjogren's syndrome/scleroderma autoantigen 1 family protein [Nitrososphaerota archaeon]